MYQIPLVLEALKLEAVLRDKKLLRKIQQRAVNR